MKAVLLRKPIRHYPATYKLPIEITLLILEYLEPHQQSILSLTNVHFHRAYHRLHPNPIPFDLRMEIADSRGWSVDWNLFSRQFMHYHITSKNPDPKPQLYQLLWDDSYLWGNYNFCSGCAKMKLAKCWDSSPYEKELCMKHVHDSDFQYLAREMENWCMKCRVKHLLLEWDDRTEYLEALPSSKDDFISKGLNRRYPTCTNGSSDYAWEFVPGPLCGMVHVGCEMCDFTREDALERLKVEFLLSARVRKFWEVRKEGEWERVIERRLGKKVLEGFNDEKDYESWEEVFLKMGLAAS